MMIGNIHATVAVVVISIVCCVASGSDLKPEKVLSYGLTVLERASGAGTRLHFQSDRKTIQALQSLCPLVDQYNEINEYVSNNAGTSMDAVEIEAAKVLLQNVINDTCEWLHDIDTNMECSHQNILKLNVLCIDIQLNNISKEAKRVLEKGVHDFTLTIYEELKWIEDKFSNKDDVSIVEAILMIMNTSRNINCIRKPTSEVCCNC